MATPPGPASPGNPISYDNIRAEVNFTPNIDIGLYDFATYIYDDGFINDYTFYPAFYPLPSSPAGGAVTQNASISMFYDIDSESYYDIQFQSGTPSWVSTIDVTINDATVLASGSNSGPNADTQTQINAMIRGGTAGNQPHWYQIDLQVNLNAGAPPFTPAVNVDYDTGAGFTAFPGSPTTFPGLLTTGAIINVANGGTVYIRVS
jgi:hypothetical protein